MPPPSQLPNLSVSAEQRWLFSDFSWRLREIWSVVPPSIPHPLLCSAVMWGGTWLGVQTASSSAPPPLSDLSAPIQRRWWCYGDGRRRRALRLPANKGSGIQDTCRAVDWRLGRYFEVALVQRRSTKECSDLVLNQVVAQLYLWRPLSLIFFASWL